MTVARLGRETDSEELSEWIAYDRINPLPDPWLQTGILASLMANFWKGAKNRKSYKPGDFIPFVKKIRKQMSLDEIRAQVQRMSGIVPTLKPPEESQ